MSVVQWFNDSMTLGQHQVFILEWDHLKKELLKNMKEQGDLQRGRDGHWQPKKGRPWGLIELHLSGDEERWVQGKLEERCDPGEVVTCSCCTGTAQRAQAKPGGKGIEVTTRHPLGYVKKTGCACDLGEQHQTMSSQRSLEFLKRSGGRRGTRAELCGALT